MKLFSMSLAVLSACLFIPLAEAQYKLEKHEGGVKVLESGKVIADYLTKSMSKPIIWPLLGPGGEKMTRDYPMVADSADEKHDHPHHRSLWFTHGEVNGVDFWLEGERGGITEHLEFTELDDGKQAVIGVRNLWKSPAGESVLSDKRRFTFGHDEQARWVDCEIELSADFGEVHFGDTKEGTFGVRVAESLSMNAKQGGMIINSHGTKGTDAWGKAAEWVDYVGPLNGKTMGIAILCHPSTFHHPNRWHVRDYGLFAANPFGVYHFEGQKEPTDGVRMKQGEKLLFRYRVVLHNGDTEAACIADRYEAFANQKFTAL
ncbi:MAG: PmoA family protein [Planctomycetales bacterium]|nr:PmoA family protein [Planctomycetales bacterium]